MATHRYGITHKESGLLFAGFDRNGKVKWTNDPSKAWAHNQLAATAQADFLASMEAGEPNIKNFSLN